MLGVEFLGVRQREVAGPQQIRVSAVRAHGLDREREGDAEGGGDPVLEEGKNHFGPGTETQGKGARDAGHLEACGIGASRGKAGSRQ
jgi:hypothetical protein